MTTSNRPHLHDIERLTGAAILLVVIGHLVTGYDINAQGLGWYKFLKSLIYSFHMPLFMFVSGYIMFYTFPEIQELSDYALYIKRKFLRLMPSYLVFAAVIFVSKFYLDKYLPIDNPVRDSVSFSDAFVKPAASYAGFLWYVYVLFEYYILIPVALLVLKNRIELLVVLSLPLHFINFPDIIALDLFFEFLIFFTLGMLAVKHSGRYLAFIDRYSHLVVIIFVLMCLGYFFYKIPKLIMGLAAIPALHSIIRKYFISRRKSILSLFGIYSFSIYLMNTLASGFVKAIGFKYLNWSYENFFLPALVMICCGLLIPIGIKKYIINKIPIINKYIG
ncbi:MAG TPA: acyltransferase [Spirochaetota bacterium]|nr:acyltransferase [Spirochaetota bacterium]